MSHCNIEVGIDVYRLDQCQGGVKDLTFYSLTSMNVVNTVDLHCYVSTLKITQRGTGPRHQCDMRLL